MTFIQQFIEKAFVGGWQPADRDCRILGFYEHYFEYGAPAASVGKFTVSDMDAPQRLHIVRVKCGNFLPKASASQRLPGG
jgi:hypothetical protein